MTSLPEKGLEIWGSPAQGKETDEIVIKGDFGTNESMGPQRIDIE